MSNFRLRFKILIINLNAMRKLIFFIFSVFLFLPLIAKTTHGDKFKIQCSVCHLTDKWNVIKPNGFNHKTTSFPLLGQHQQIDCKRCHASLVFSEVKSECNSCHADVHQGTVGRDCENCHNSSSWMINNIKPIHQQSGFPLSGMHAATDCQRCHVSASNLRFNNMRTDCYSCHKPQYDAVANPNHVASNFSTDCLECHNASATSWGVFGKNFHTTFPLNAGHNIDCIKCHITGEYKTPLSTDCMSCHAGKLKVAKQKFAGHINKYSNDCSLCHKPLDWNTVRYELHASNFEIYSGFHKLGTPGSWNSCIDCHNNDVTYKANCQKCHPPVAPYLK